jgi:hypothetical protein
MFLRIIKKFISNNCVRLRYSRITFAKNSLKPGLKTPEKTHNKNG